MTAVPMDHYRHAFRLAYTIRGYDHLELFGRICLLQLSPNSSQIPHLVGEVRRETYPNHIPIPQNDMNGWGPWLWSVLPQDQFTLLLAGQLTEPYILDRGL